jgi:predicted site-specific integrase-resolvase
MPTFAKEELNVNYGYARVSSKSQNLDRQIEELKMFGLSEAQLYARAARILIVKLTAG